MAYLTHTTKVVSNPNMFFMDYFNAATTLLSTIFYPIIPSIGNSGTSFVMGLEVVDISPSGTDASPASHILASSAVFCMPSGSFYIDESDTVSEFSTYDDSSSTRTRQSTNNNTPNSSKRHSSFQNPATFPSL